MEPLDIYINKTTLSDKSEVFAVEIGIGETVPCISEKDAEAFAEGIKALFEKHTNGEASVIYSY